MARRVGLGEDDLIAVRIADDKEVHPVGNLDLARFPAETFVPPLPSPSRMWPGAWILGEARTSLSSLRTKGKRSRPASIARK